MEKHIRYKGKGEHSINELEKIIEQREQELHLFRSGQKRFIQDNVVQVRNQFYCWDGAVGEQVCENQCKDCLVEAKAKKR